MPLTLTQLHTFARLAAIGNFTRTAEELSLSQPAVTQQVRALADHFGTPLFDMVGRRPVLTDAGSFLAERVGDVLAGVHALEREMHEFADARFGTLDIGATVTIGNYTVLPTVAAFRKAYPAATLRLHVANTVAIVEAIHGRRFGVALVEGPVRDPAILVEAYATDELTLIVPPHDHRLSGLDAIGPAQLAGEAFVAREEGSGTRTVAEEALRVVGVTPNVVLTLPSGEGVARAVEAGVGVAILPLIVVERAVAAGRVKPVRVTGVDFTRPFSIIRLRERTPSPLASRFLGMLRGD
jgi:LysR family transcriptional regulator, transcriptional activator of the cysJI operon